MNDCETCNKNQNTCNPDEDFCQGHESKIEQQEFEYLGTFFKITKHAIDRVSERFPKMADPAKFIEDTIKKGFYHFKLIQYQLE